MRVVVLAVLALLFATPPVHGESIEDQQWHLGALDAYEAHEISRGDGVVVAVVDSGVDETVADLAGRLLPGTGFGSAAGNGGVRDTDGHGTSMAVLIAGQGRGGALGIAPGAKILPVAAGTDGENFASGAVSESVRWAVDHGADVVNLSLGTPVESTPDLKAAVEYAFAKDVVVVAATGNDGARHIGAPANVLGVIAVSGTVQDGSPWPSSNTGALTVLSAPAQDIVTASPLSVSESGYSQVSGTSAAAALVSGVAALVRSKYPDMSAANVVNRLVTSATDVAEPGRDEATGFGAVAPLAALTATIPPVNQNPLLPGGTVVPQDPAAASADDPADPATLLALAGGALVLAAIGGLVAWRRARERRGPRIEVVAGWEPPPPSDDFWRPKY
ncbi:S8 family serine peptidase [Umezawaea endophytica]|uniref:S8 family serine peptidase n=1 Tax=Umezawaea endophytica TaxID=1654476 RepID=A0A9X2VYR8_9PSEU|nr:S8 family serine peptidase [Umezawaea endophytica]MCS7484872.1 S8 family serine peptidase [Umezawaea endophytica]